MRVLVQRVSEARVSAAGELLAQIGPGVVLLAGFHVDDDEAALRFCAEKCAHLRIFADAAGRMNRSVLDVGGQALVISQFTLYGDCRRGRRPSFNDAAPPAAAAPLYQRFLALCRELGLPTAGGRFGSHMQVALINDGPVTLMLESP